jgi:hypothetical protein
LNTRPARADPVLVGAVLRETLARGGRAIHPVLAVDGLSAAFIEPALRMLGQSGARVHLGQRLLKIDHEGDQVIGLASRGAQIDVGADEAVILAVPPREAARLIPGLKTPNAFCSILNAHFAAEAPPGCAPLTGIIGGTTQWLFVYPGRLSVTISDADEFADIPKSEMGRQIWSEVSAVTGALATLPPFRLVHEREATFAATPEQTARRPSSDTPWRNLAIAGDWTETGLPATIEGAVRSGETAARLLMRRRVETKSPGQWFSQVLSTVGAAR